MPSITAITVKSGDGTTDVVFSPMTPSSGDSTAAMWRAEAIGGGVSSNKPVFTMKTQNNGARTARRAELYFSYPRFVTDTTTNTTRVVSNVPVNVTVTIPNNVPDTEIANAVALFTNLMASALIKSSLTVGFAPT